MKNTLFRTTVAAAVVAMLAACGGGGGGSDIGSSVVKISFDEPTGVLEAGRLVTVTGHAVSSSSKLATMNWTVAGAGNAASTPTVTNADCAQATRSDSNFAAGSSNWTCVLTLQAPKALPEATTYELGLSATSATFSGKGTTKVTIKPASVAANPVQVQIGTLPTPIRAGEATTINGVVSSNASKVTGARWTVTNAGANQNSAFPVPTLENADCAVKTENANPSGQESSTWNCPVRMIVSPRLLSPATYKLTLVGNNANGFSTTSSVDVPVDVAPATSNKISVSLVPTPLAARAGDLITLRGTIKSTDAKIDLTKSQFAVLNVTPANSVVGVANSGLNTALAPTNCVRVAVSAGAVKDELSCSTTLTMPAITTAVTLTYALQGVDDEANYNFASADITVQPGSDAFGLRANVAYAPVPVVAGAPVNLTCQGQGSGPYTYTWRVANSNGTVVNLSSASTTTGNASFNAPAPLVDTDVVVECGLSNGTTVVYTPLTVKIPGSTSPLGFRADVNATPNPTTSGETVNLTCQGLGVANATYSYTWRVTNANGMVVNLVNGANGNASFVAPALVPPAGGGGVVAAPVTLTCSASDGSRVITQPLDVVINPV